MKRFLKILTNWKKIVALIELIKIAAKDKKVSGYEAKQVLDKAVDLLVDMGIISKD